ncbi:MAG: S8 family peptidase, partial [Anaerolineae bacterium]|nr:S8 family peptidase [Anaerolineae bacterium]
MTLESALPVDDVKAESPAPSFSAAGLTTIMSENFEGAFPTGLWSVFDDDGATNGEYYWDDITYKPYAGTYSAWAGASGLSPSSYYTDYMKSWMVYGPFDLSDAAAANLQFYYWSKTELDYDYFGWYASADGTNFYGTRVSGAAASWNYVDFDLTNVPTLGDLSGDSSVWIAFIFTSDGSGVDVGSFVDNVVLQKTTLTSVYLPLVVRNYAPRLFPNDTNFTLQWGLHNTGQTGGYENADINAPEAWYLTTGSSDVVVAVIDTGVYLNHPEFSGRLTSGWDFANNDSNANDDNGHGTHVAGIIGAAGNNTSGVAGVAWQTRIMPVKVLDSSGSGTYSDIVDGILYAANNGADVINMSLGGTSYASSMQSAVTYAYNKGVIVVAAAGNCGDSYYMYNGCTSMNQTNYPAAMNNVLAVASTTDTDSRSSFSNQNSYVDIAAPGSEIYSTWTSSNYRYDSGTSMASPFVAGLAALIRAKYPSYTPFQVAQAIVHSATDLGSAGRDNAFGCGRIDAQRALAYGAVSSGCSGWSGFSVSDAEVESASVPDPEAAFAPGVLLVKFDEESVS